MKRIALIAAVLAGLCAGRTALAQEVGEVSQTETPAADENMERVAEKGQGAAKPAETDAQRYARLKNLRTAQARLIKVGPWIEQMTDAEYSDYIGKYPNLRKESSKRWLTSRSVAVGYAYRTVALFDYGMAGPAGPCGDAGKNFQRLFKSLDKADIDTRLSWMHWLFDTMRTVKPKPEAATQVADVDSPRLEAARLSRLTRGIDSPGASLEEKMKLHCERGKIYERKAAAFSSALAKVSDEEGGSPVSDEEGVFVVSVLEEAGVYDKGPDGKSQAQLPQNYKARSAPPPAPPPPPPPPPPRQPQWGSTMLRVQGKLPMASLKGGREFTPGQIYKRAGPAVVLLVCVGRDGIGEMGTGSVIDEQGRILTNAHVVLRKPENTPYERIQVYFKPARLTGDPRKDAVNAKTARVVRSDPKLDLALLELNEKPSKLALIAVGDSERIEPGEPVVAIGHPEQGGLWTLTQGVVSTVVADIGGVKGKDVFQTDASINRGNSGGPLIARDGSLIGINTLVARQSPKDGMTITAVNFSVKSNVARDWLAREGVKVVDAEAASVAEASSGGEVAVAEGQGETAASEQQPETAVAEQQPETAVSEEQPETAVADTGSGEPVAAADAEKVAEKAAPAPEAKILTPRKPFKIQDMIAREIAAMEDLEGEMMREVEKRRSQINR